MKPTSDGAMIEYGVHWGGVHWEDGSIEWVGMNDAGRRKAEALIASYVVWEGVLIKRTIGEVELA